MGSSAFRNIVASLYGFPLLSDSDVSIVAGHLLAQGVHQVFDPMAGTGFQASLFGQAGLGVIACDKRPAQSFQGGLSWHHVDECCVEAVDWMSVAPDTALLLSWPPRWSSAGEIALGRFQGRYLVFVGDRGCWTGSEAFHAMLAKEWREVMCLPILCWPRMEDDVRIYERRV